MSVTNGQTADQDTFNNAFVSKTVASTVVGVVTLTGWDSVAVTDGQAATAITGHTVDGATYKAAVYEYVIKRGTTVVAAGRFSLFYVNGTWELQTGGYESAGGLPHGVAFTITQATTVATLKAALDAGAGNGTIQLTRKLVPV
jgi:hypothetical protein